MRILSVPAIFAMALIATFLLAECSSAAAQAKTKVNPGDGLTYAWIAPGAFEMGCSNGDSQCEKDEKPAHMVKLTKGFWIGQTLVTQAAYKKVIGTNPSMFKGDGLPVDYVSFDDATAYCAKVGMRLPTEAEYEYAARGGKPDARYASLDSIGWYSANSAGTTHDVGKKQPNAYGLYDMLGNLWVWTGDWYGRYTAGEETDPTGPKTGPAGVLKGGSWRNEASRIRASARLTDGRANQFYEYGIRCAGN